MSKHIPLPPPHDERNIENKKQYESGQSNQILNLCKEHQQLHPVLADRPIDIQLASQTIAWIGVGGQGGEQ